MKSRCSGVDHPWAHYGFTSARAFVLHPVDVTRDAIGDPMGRLGTPRTPFPSRGPLGFSTYLRGTGGGKEIRHTRKLTNAVCSFSPQVIISRSRAGAQAQIESPWPLPGLRPKRIAHRVNWRE